MSNSNKEVKRPVIRINTALKVGVWAIIPGKTGVLANTRNEAIALLKEKHPGEYDIIDVVEEYAKRNRSQQEQPESSAELNDMERMEIAAHMSKL